MGGMYNWNQVESIRLAGTIERDGRTADIVIIKKRPNQIRATITLPPQDEHKEPYQIIRAHDGKHAWTALRQAGAPKLSAQELDTVSAEALLNDSSILPRLINLQQQKCKFTLLGVTRIDGRQAYAIVATPTESTSQTFYIDTDTFQTIRYATETTTSKTFTSLEDYTKKAGVVIPRRSVITATDSTQTIIKIDSIEIGPGIYNEYFKMAQQ